MQTRGKVINKLALVLLSIIVLELVLIGDQVQPVKAIKKKIYLKKLKKILPLLALVKPKKKLILVPIPIPMFKKEPFRNYVPQVQPHMAVSKPMSMVGSNGAMSFMMVDPNVAMGPAIPEASSIEPSQMMTMPSMTMTIQSDGTGTMSAIELTPGAANANNSTSGALITAGRPSKWNEQQHYDFHSDEQFSLNEFLQPIKQRPREGDHYYASPWASNAVSPPGSRLPLVSPAKFVRNGRLKQQLNSWTSSSRRPTESSQSKETSEPIQATRQQTIALITTNSQPKKQPKQGDFTQPMPIVTIKSQWRHAGLTQQATGGAATTTAATTAAAIASEEAQVSERIKAQQLVGPKLSKQQEQQIASALEQESLIQVGPTRLIPIYQSANGRISMTPPPMMAHHYGSGESASEGYSAAQLNAEVQTNDAGRNQFRSAHDQSFERDSSAPSSETVPKSNRLSTERSKRPPVDGVKRSSDGTQAGAY